jgi:hypothetical protein
MSKPIVASSASGSGTDWRAGLKAIHRILVQARWLADRQADHQKIAAVLDSAELMPMLLMQQPRPDECSFRDLLDDLSQRYPEFQGILEEYDLATR